jgi:hypothetical protein
VHNPSGLVAFKCAIEKQFVLEDPFTGDDVCARRLINQALGSILLECLELERHGGVPVRVLQSSPCRLGNGEMIGGAEVAAIAY